MPRTTACLLALLSALCVFLCLLRPAQSVVTAKAKLTPTENFGEALNISGEVTFTVESDGNVTVHVSVTGNIADGDYGIHVHQFGDLTNSATGTSVGTHYVGGGSTQHNCPDSDERHEGDMGNWHASSGAIDQSKSLNLLELMGVNSIVGLAVVMHAHEDNCTSPAGFAGNYLAFGTIGITNVANNTAKNENTTISAAVAVLQPTSNCNDSCGGTVWLTEEAGGVRIIAKVSGLELNSKHGFHVHTYGDLSNADGSSAGTHWNPAGTIHEVPDNVPRHAGDLGSIQSFDQATGLAWYNALNTNIGNVESLLGRSVVIHALVDHGSGYGCDQAGGSGKRVMIGVIGAANGVTSPETPPVAVDSTFENADCTIKPGAASTLTSPLSFLWA